MMRIDLTPEQRKQILEDEVLEIKGDDGMAFYFEFKRNKFDYCELNLGADDEKGIKRNTISFDRKDLQKIIPQEPHYGYANSEECPSCGLHLIYKFNCCPECGQTIKWASH